MRFLAGCGLAERIQKTLVFTGRHQAALNTQLLHQVRKAETIHQHTNTADHTGLIDKDVIGTRRNVISR